jgi:hypothetical protein
MDLGFNLMAEEIPAPTNLPWDEVRDVASRAFHVWVEQPELAWAKSAWQLLADAKLTTYRSELERYEVFFRLLALAGIYSDFCDAAWEERSDLDYSSWAEPLKLEPFLLGQLYARLPEWNPENEETAYQALNTLIENQREQVVVALMAAHGGASGLYASLWQSQHAEGEDHGDDDTYYPEISQQAAYSWVDQGVVVIAEVRCARGAAASGRNAYLVGALLVFRFTASVFPGALRFASRAATALRAISERCSGVSFLMRASALSFPPFEPCFLKNSNASGGIFLLGTFAILSRLRCVSKPFRLTSEGGSDDNR